MMLLAGLVIKFFYLFFFNDTATTEIYTLSLHYALPIFSQLKKELPKVYQEFAEITQLLEKHYRDMQDCEFTIERGKLWMLQTRTGKRTGAAAVRIAVDMASEKLIDRQTAVRRVTPEQLDQLLHPTVDPKADSHVLATGLPASPGAASGKVVFTPDEADEMAREGEKV